MPKATSANPESNTMVSGCPGTQRGTCAWNEDRAHEKWAMPARINSAPSATRAVCCNRTCDKWRLDDLFTPQRIHACIQGVWIEPKVSSTKLRTLTLAQFPDAEPGGVAARAANYKHLTLTPIGVKLVFEKYQILPGVAGAPSFVAPWASLATVIRPSIVARSLGGSVGGPGPHIS
jgi:hypothetical protein